jgi:hypothetical protein
MPLRPEQLARLCHEADRVLCGLQGDARVLPWDLLDENAQDELVASVREILEAPEVSDEARHLNWATRQRALGWAYGPVRSVVKKIDPGLLDYGALPFERRVRWSLFAAIVRALRLPTPEEVPRSAALAGAR